MAGDAGIQATQTQAPEASSHALGDIWHKVSSKATDVAQGAVHLGQEAAAQAPGMIKKGTDKVKSLDTPENERIAKEAGRAGVKGAMVGGIHGAVFAAGESVVEQKTGHKLPFNPLHIKEAVTREVIDRATSTTPRSDAPPASPYVKIGEKSLPNPFRQTDAPAEKAVPMKIADSAPGFLSGIKNTAKRFLPNTTITEEPEVAPTKR
jgi:hypothetical protein